MKPDIIRLDATTLHASLLSLDDAKAGQLIKSILAIHLGNDDAVADLQPDVRMAFEVIRAQLLAQREKDSERSRIYSENVRKRWAKKALPEAPPQPQPDTEPELIIEEVIPIQEEPPKPKGKSSTPCTHANYDWVAPEMFPIFSEWCEFRRKSGKTFKDEKYVHQNYNKLMNLSRGDPTLAKAIVEQSISNGYQGLFPLKQSSNGLTTKFERQVAAEQQFINAVATDCADRIQRDIANSQRQERFVPPKL